ncbi:MAG: 4Fe-4S binding protein, partial [Gemmataceae bacterium]|nr:4Fe-4S binding protein [Gemmataceae bacterium]
VVTTRAGLDGYNPETRAAADEKVIKRAAADVDQSVRMLAEFLVADHCHEPLTDTKRYEDELSNVAQSLNVSQPRQSLRRPAELPSRNAGADAIPKSRRFELPLLPTLQARELDEELPRQRNAWEEWNTGIDEGYPYSSRTVVVDHDRCILCDRCVRACSEVKPFKVIGHTGKGYGTRISFDLDSIMRESTCVQCGECMNSCPTGALSLRRRVRPRAWEDSPEQIPVNPNTSFPKESGFLTADEMRDVWLVYESPTRGKRVVFPFRSIPYSYLKWNEGAVRRWEIEPGERKVLCEEGEYGSTAFLLQGSGTFEIYVKGKAGEQKKGFLASLFGGSGGGGRKKGDYGALVRVASGDELILGEMTCVTQRPRAATVVGVADPDNRSLVLSYDENGWPVAAPGSAAGPVVVYEITRNMLDMMQRAASAREDVQEMYTLRAVQTGVQSGRIFELLDPMEREQA